MHLESPQRQSIFQLGEILDVQVRQLSKFKDDRGWLVELFRNDDLAGEFHPVMAYISSTRPGITRGPHEHVDQADLFCFVGPSTFKLRMWDNRADSQTYRNVMTLLVGENDPKAVVIPKGVVHAYQNVGDTDGFVINCPNRLYKGERRSATVDEIRHEDDPDTIFAMDD